MLSSKRTAFGEMCRELRRSRHMKLRQVAEAIHVAESTYGNVESSQWRVIGRDKAEAIADLHRLPVPDRVRLLELWEATPFSKFSEDRRKRWKANNERRGMAKRVPALEWSLVLVLGVHVGAMPEDQICACPAFGGDPCEVCEALAALGLDTYTTREAAIAQLTKLQGKLEAARAAAPGQVAP